MCKKLNHFLIRIVAAFLIPSLLTGPLMAAAGGSAIKSKNNFSVSCQSALFSNQALTAPLREAFHNSLSSFTAWLVRLTPRLQPAGGLLEATTKSKGGRNKFAENGGWATYRPRPSLADRIGNLLFAESIRELGAGTEEPSSNSHGSEPERREEDFNADVRALQMLRPKITIDLDKSPNQIALFNLENGLKALSSQRSIDLVDDVPRVMSRVSPYLLRGDDPLKQAQFNLMGNLLVELASDLSGSSLYRSGHIDLGYPTYQLQWGSPWGNARAIVSFRLQENSPLVRFKFQLEVDGNWTTVGFLRWGSDLDSTFWKHQVPHLDASVDDKTSWLQHVFIQDRAKPDAVTQKAFYQMIKNLYYLLSTVPRQYYVQPHHAPQSAINFATMQFSPSRIKQFRTAILKLSNAKKQEHLLSVASVERVLRLAPTEPQTIAEMLNVKIKEQDFPSLINILETVREGALLDKPTLDARNEPPPVYFYHPWGNSPASEEEVRRALRQFRRLAGGRPVHVVFVSEIWISTLEDLAGLATSGSENEVLSEDEFRKAYQNEVRRQAQETQVIQHQIDRLSHLSKLAKNGAPQLRFGYFQLWQVLLNRFQFSHASNPYPAWRKLYEHFYWEMERHLAFQNKPMDLSSERAFLIESDERKTEIVQERQAALSNHIRPFLENGRAVLIISKVPQMDIGDLTLGFDVLPLPIEGAIGVPPSAQYLELLLSVAADAALSEEATIFHLAAGIIEDHLRVGSDAEMFTKMDRLLNHLGIERIRAMLGEFSRTESMRNVDNLMRGIITGLIEPHLEGNDRNEIAKQLRLSPLWISELWTMVAFSDLSVSLNELGLGLLAAIRNGTQFIREPLTHAIQKHPAHVISTEEAA
jgi:hypothetical protein